MTWETQWTPIQSETKGHGDRQSLAGWPPQLFWSAWRPAKGCDMPCQQRNPYTNKGHKVAHKPIFYIHKCVMQSHEATHLLASMRISPREWNMGQPG